MSAAMAGQAADFQCTVPLMVIHSDTVVFQQMAVKACSYASSIAGENALDLEHQCPNNYFVVQ